MGTLFSRYKGRCRNKKLLIHTEDSRKFRHGESGLAGPELWRQEGSRPVYLLEGLPLPSQVPCAPDTRYQVSQACPQQGWTRPCLPLSGPSY
jgi:hypothetical protein